MDEEPRGVFSIDKFTGKVFLNAMLDREKTDRFRVRSCVVRPVPLKQAWWEASAPPPHQASPPRSVGFRPDCKIQAPLSEGAGTGVWDRGPAAGGGNCLGLCAHLTGGQTEVPWRSGLVLPGRSTLQLL